MKTTRYFAEQVLRKRPYISVDQCASVLDVPLRRVIQSDGRIRWWGRVVDVRDGVSRVLRVIRWTTARQSTMLSSIEATVRTRYEAALLSGDR
jgi:hypothetical protein